MKKTILAYAIALAFFATGVTVSAQESGVKSTQTEVSAKVEVYYFHYTRRCKTCKNVEANAQNALQSLYANQVKSGLYSFKSVSLDDAEGKAEAQKVGANGQSLLVVSGKKKVDITDKGFMNANNIERMKTEVQKAVESVLK